jgi:hypothetical protein
MGNQVHCKCDGQCADLNQEITMIMIDQENVIKSDVQASEFLRPALTSHVRRQTSGMPVFLNIYHLSESWKQTNRIASELLGFGGAFHAAIEVFGDEYSYGCEGVRRGIPRCDPEHVYHRSILMGETDYTHEELQDLIKELEREWPGDDYDMFRRNCCNFSSFLSEELVDVPIPAWVNRLAQIASNSEILNGDIRHIVN